MSCFRVENGAAVAMPVMADGFTEQSAQDRAKDLTPTNWLAPLLDRETAHRVTKRFKSRLRNAKLHHGQASVEDVNYRAPRKRDEALFQQLATCRLAEHHPRWRSSRAGQASQRLRRL